MRRAGGRAAEELEAAARRRPRDRGDRLAAHRLVRRGPLHVGRPRPDRRDVRVDVGPDHDRRDGLARFLRLRPRLVLLAGADALARRHGRDRLVRRHPAAARDRRPRAVLRRGAGPDDEKVAPQIRRTAALLWRLYAALTVAADRRAVAGRHAALRRGLQHVRRRSPPADSRRIRCRSAATRTPPPNG